MTSTKEAFSLRKQGRLDEAYAIAKGLCESDSKDPWNIRALGWCIVDLAKKSARTNNPEALQSYVKELDMLAIEPDDEILTKQVMYVKGLADEAGQLKMKARELSKAGRHAEAVKLYRQIVKLNPSDLDACTAFAWELWRLAKQDVSRQHINVYRVKCALLEYLSLATERPSRLHSLFLRVAIKLADERGFDLGKFVQHWDLENLQEEDFEATELAALRQTDDKESIYGRGGNHHNDQKTFPSLAESVIQKATKAATHGADVLSCEYLKPFLNSAIERFPNNIWLKLYKAHLLLVLGETEGALESAIEVAREKPGEFWIWELLGDTQLKSNPNCAFSCYCKALLVSRDAKFTPKVKGKLAKLLEKKGEYAEAKYEVLELEQTYQKEGWKLPSTLEEMKTHAWFNTDARLTGDEFYSRNCSQAEDLLFAQYPWLEGNVGPISAVKGKLQKRALFVHFPEESFPLEVLIPERLSDFSGHEIGSGVKLKGDLDADKHFRLLKVSIRENASRWDVFGDGHVAVVTNRNRKAGVIGFIVSKTVNGVFSITTETEELEAGDVVELKIAAHFVRGERRYRGYDARRTQLAPDSSVRRDFSGQIKLRGSIGFVDHPPIFVIPSLIEANGINDQDYVSGVAVLSYEEKKSRWGWRAVSLVQKLDRVK